jgi:hypothetical protein
MSKLPDLTEQELNSLQGRTVIITGGASGIGHAAVLIAHGNSLLHSQALHSVLTSRKLMVQTSPLQILLKMLVKPWQLN